MMKKFETEITPAAPSGDLANWTSTGLSDEVASFLLSIGFDKPTPVQVKAIPPAMEGIDLIVSAPTGTGKTAAFVLPLIEALKGTNGTYGLVLCPSREIALQTQLVFEKLGQKFGLKSVALIGGVGMDIDRKALNTYPNVIVATPGRLCDHIERGNIWLEFLKIVILDEADRMLDMGFSEQLNRILRETPTDRQTLLYSATIPPGVEKLARNGLYQPIRISIGGGPSPTTLVEQRFLFISEQQKVSELQRLIRNEKGTMFVFTRSKVGARRLYSALRRRGHLDVTQLHSDLPQEHREQSLKDFKDGLFRIIVATDVIGRGVHVDDVAHVVNYDLPRDPTDYVHRIGRTGRAEKRGLATTFVTPRDRATFQKIEKLIGRTGRNRR